MDDDADIESAEERGYWKGYHAAIRKCDAETIKMLDIKLLANSGKRLKKAVAPMIEKAKQEAYAKGKADGFEEIARTCSECQKAQYQQGYQDGLEKAKDGNTANYTLGFKDGQAYEIARQSQIRNRKAGKGGRSTQKPCRKP